MQRVGRFGSVFCGHILKRGFDSLPQRNTYFKKPFVRHITVTNMSYSVVHRGCPNTLDYRIFLEGPNGIVSPFHDIPLFHNKEENIVNMIVEVPRWTNAKMEIDTKSKMNPIKQDIKKGKLRFVNNCFPHHGYIWNYGALPQTWEDPKHTDEHTEQAGDNDPIDVCEIGHKVHTSGSVVQVKVLGIMALIDEGETDWKVLAIDVNDPLAEKLNDIGDVEKCMPGFIRATNEWFRIYKIPTGKPENQFAFNGEAKDKNFALGIINQTHEQWNNLMSGATTNEEIACANTTIDGAHKMSVQDAEEVTKTFPEPGPAAEIDQEVNKWHYIQL